MLKRLAALLLAALAAGLSLSAAAASPAQWANEEFNYSTVAQDGFVYTSVRGPLERISLQTLERQTVVKADASYNLKEFSVQGGSIYWLGKGAIYQCRADGSGLSTVDAGPGAARTLSNLRVSDGWLYYLSGGSLFRVKPDGSGRKQLGGGVDRFELAGGFLYYVPEGGGSLCRCDPDGGNAAEAAELDGDWKPQVHNDTLYYCTGDEDMSYYFGTADSTAYYGSDWYKSTKNGLIKPSLAPSRIPNGYLVRKEVAEVGSDWKPSVYRTVVKNRDTNKTLFTLPDTGAYSLFGTQTHLYFTQTDKEPGFYRIGWDGQNKEKLAASGEPILLAGGYVVYLTDNDSDIAFVKD
ncbi:DUF5050 domain-containing protein [uncultured Anaerotruncus sp.]|uniref:DUF5050 domain-containing protein n=1 Tax=uncultured Anaerotruncus sp. TaxID=905011 RepID=UPI00280B93DD|nr:DUF5050 domain-containing protein [uncultured Anaerotruncus sp.]